MNPQLVEYIKSAREHKASNAEIEAMLVGSGWESSQVKAALAANLDLPLPPPPPPSPAGVPTNVMPAPATPAQPIAVVSNLTTRGLEYTIMFLALAIAATSLGWILHGFVDSAFGAASGFYESGVSFASAALIVTFPIFAFLFIRLKRAELANEALKHDASRKRMVQLTMIVTFLVGIGHIVSYIFGLLNASTYSAGEVGAGGNLVHTIITLGIAGGIFTYYWIDDHRVAS